MFFSVIVTIYNGEAFLSPCLDSILRNPAGNYELIVVDDGSTDNSGMICDGYAGRYSQIKCVHTENRGIGNARQTGLEEASGEYIIFVDGDDAWDESFCLIKLEETIKKSFVDLYVFGFILRRIKQEEAGDSLFKVKESSFEDWRDNQAQFLSYFPNGLMFPCWNKIFNRAIIQRYNLSFRSQQMEDFLFVLDYLNAIRSVSFLPLEPYVYYKRSEGMSLTKQIHLNMAYEYGLCHNRFLSLFDSELTHTIHQIMAPQYIATINKCLRYNDANARSILVSIKQIPLAKLSLRAYEPVSVSDKITISLMQKGFYNLLSFYRKCVEVFQRNQSYE